MTTPPTVAVNRDGLTSPPFGLRAARLAVLFVAIVNVATAGRGIYQAVTVVRSDRLPEFVWRFVMYPATVAVLAVLAVWLLHRHRATGAVMASLALLLHGLRTLVAALSGHDDGLSANVSATTRTTAVVVEVLVGLFFLASAASFAAAARMMRGRERTLPRE